MGVILCMILLDCFVIGVIWVDDVLWYGIWEDGCSDLWWVDLVIGVMFECLDMLVGKEVSGLEWDGVGCFYCGGGNIGVVCVVWVFGCS